MEKHVEEERVACTELLPVEMWEAILDQVDSMSDLINCYRTCRTWQTILFARVKPTLELGKVIPLVRTYLGNRRRRLQEYRELIKCRLVCRKWKETIDATFIQEDWDWGDKFKYDVDDYLDWTSLSPTLQGTKVSSQRRASFLRFMDSEPKGNPFPSRTLQIKCTTEELDDHHDYSLEQRCFFPGEQVHNLIYHTTRQNGLTVREDFLTSLVTQFPNLRRLKFIFSITAHSCYNGSGIKSKANKEAVALRKTDDKCHHEGLMKSLVELTVSNAEQVMPLPHLISSLILSSPSLEKVTLVWGDYNYWLDEENGQGEHRKHVSIVLDAISRAGGVKELVLIGWENSFNLAKFLPRRSSGSWPLKRLTLRLQSTAHGSVVGISVSNVFLLLLKKFSKSLEELRLQVPVLLCRGHGLFTHEEKWHRTCACNDYFDKAESYRDKLQFRLFCENNRFERLRILGTGHALLHPSIFPGVMRACSVLEELWIYHSLNHKWWGEGSDGPRTEDVLRRTVSELWAESPPPSLRLIVVSKWGPQKWNYKFPRRSFRECGSFDEGKCAERDYTEAGGGGATRCQEKAQRKCQVL